MAQILYAWELGAGLGHTTVFLPFARELRRRGHYVTWALRELQQAEPVLGPHGFDWWQAPYWHYASWLPRRETFCLEDILLAQGYASPVTLSALLQGWHSLLEACRPQLVVADFAPSAQLAARALGVPFIRFGTGFANPVPADTAVSLQAWRKVDARHLLQSHEPVWRSVQGAHQALGWPVPQSAAEWHRSAADLLTTVGLLDHHGPRACPLGTPEPYLGPLLSQGVGVSGVWPDLDGPKVLAYLKPDHDQAPAVLRALVAAGACVQVFAPGANQSDWMGGPHPRVSWSAHPLDMRSALTHADAVVCHAGHGTVVDALCAGRPMLLLPTALEQSINAYRLVNHGVAISVEPQFAPSDLKHAVDRLLSDVSLKKAARETAQKYGPMATPEAQARLLRRAADMCEELLR